MTRINNLNTFQVPLGGQEIELQEITHTEGGMPMLRIRIREGKRFTIFDIDPLTAKAWSDTMRDWVDSQQKS